eukprot:gene17631-17835_t
MTLNGEELSGLSAGALKPPLVSFDYSFFECIIIDNGSSDDSVDVIKTHIEADDRFKLIELDHNMGQLGASMLALDHIRGGFVTFVDSDDVLFPTFCSTHLQVHLALPRNCLTLNHADALRGLRPDVLTPRLSTISNSNWERLCGNTAVIPPSAIGWLWSPGTANMFRRSVLNLLRVGDGQANLMRSADVHFNTLAHSLGGTGIIDVPLSAYRIHGGNYYATGESIDSLMSGTVAYNDKKQANSLQSTEILLERAREFSWLLQKSFWPTIDHSASAWPIELKSTYAMPVAVSMFAKHAAALRKACGDRAFFKAISKRFLPSHTKQILDYPHFECVVIDNNSTDNSRHVIDGLIGQDSRLRAVFNPVNLDQMGALLSAINDLKGDYLVIVDADDFLLSNYASVHLAAHLAIPNAIAFTSASVIEVDEDGQCLTGGYDPFLAQRAGVPLKDAQSARPYAHLFKSGITDDLICRITHVLPPDVQGWLWSPGTANMYKMSQVKDVLPRTSGPVSVASTDNYLLPITHALSGSAQICMPLSGYRIHGRNRFGATPSVYGLFHGTMSGIARSKVRRREIIRTLVSRAQFFFKKYPDSFWTAMNAPAMVDGMGVHAFFRNKFVQAIIAEHYHELVMAFGSQRIKTELFSRMKRSGYARFRKIKSKIIR